MGEIIPVEKHLTLPEATLPLEYTVPYDWGSLHVSQEAHDSYGIMPFCPNVIEGGQFDSSKQRPDPRLDVFLVGPKESQTQGSELHSVSQIYKHGIGIAVAFPDNQVDLHQKIVSDLNFALSQLHEDAPKNILEYITDEDGIPAVESVEHDIPQLFAHTFASLSGLEMAAALETWINRYDSNRIYRQVKLLGAGGIVGAGVVLTPALLADSHIGIGNLVIPSVYLTTYWNLARLNLKRFFRNQEQKQEVAKLTSKVAGLQISDSIHKTFCSRHFDLANEPRLGEDKEE